MAPLMAIARESADGLPVIRICHALSLGRAPYDRWPQAGPEAEGDMELRAQIQLLALERPADGSRRITHALHRITHALHRQGGLVHHKRVWRLMREDNLRCLRHKRFVRTTDGAHGLLVYPHRLPELTITGLDQLWVADITSIRLPQEFVYLAVLLDASSRRCMGWALDRHLEAELALAALQMALATRPIRPGLVHHSDRGVQYASHADTTLLKESGIRISMSRTGHPYDKAQAESFIKTLKYEEVYVFEYHNLAEARGRIGQCIEAGYNDKRRHSALGYRPPAEFER
jgi:putative transposase